LLCVSGIRMRFMRHDHWIGGRKEGGGGGLIEVQGITGRLYRLLFECDRRGAVSNGNKWREVREKRMVEWKTTEERGGGW
jgi:hypothetical protein